MLPSIIDTIIFIKGGDIATVYTLKMTVKVPHGFRDKDLARPVVEVRNFKNDRLEYEIYNFGNDVVINPINPRSGGSKPKGQRSRNSSFKKKSFGRIDLEFDIKKEKILIKADPQHASQNIEIYADGRQIFTGSLSRNSEISLSLSNKDGRSLLKEIDRSKDIYAKIK